MLDNQAVTCIIFFLAYLGLVIVILNCCFIQLLEFTDYYFANSNTIIIYRLDKS